MSSIPKHLFCLHSMSRVNAPNGGNLEVRAGG
jgi:hypothetical protein